MIYPLGYEGHSAAYYKSLKSVRLAWQQHYMAKGCTERKATELARKKHNIEHLNNLNK